MHKKGDTPRSWKKKTKEKEKKKEKKNKRGGSRKKGEGGNGGNGCGSPRRGKEIGRVLNRRKKRY